MAEIGYQVKGYCAGIEVFDEHVRESGLTQFLTEKKLQLKQGELTMTFAMGVVQECSLLCVDVFDSSGAWLPHLMSDFKR